MSQQNCAYEDAEMEASGSKKKSGQKALNNPQKAQEAIAQSFYRGRSESMTAGNKMNGWTDDDAIMRSNAKDSQKYEPRSRSVS